MGHLQRLVGAPPVTPKLPLTAPPRMPSGSRPEPTPAGSSTHARRPWLLSLLVLTGLALFFFASYNLANQWAAQQAQRGLVATLVFDWERQIPFWPWTILPYWSIDIFYGLSILLCASRAAVWTQAARLLAAQLISVLCFVLWPLRFSFDKPAVAGWLGTLFDALAGFDQPFNQAPSLHISLLLILWVFYAERVTGRWRWLVHGWCALIGLSVLTTFQHHFIDVPTGAWVGFFCLWLFPQADVGAAARTGFALRCAWSKDTADSQWPRRRQLALRYGIAAVLVAGVAGGLGLLAGWSLAWLAGAFLWVAMAYGYLGPAAFQKNAVGRMSVGAFGLFLPYLVAAWLNSRLWTWRDAKAVEVVPQLWLGRAPTCADLRRLGLRSVVDTSAEMPMYCANVKVYSLAQLDLVAPSAASLLKAATLIEQARQASAAEPVLVFCALGYGRSVSAIAAWLLRYGGCYRVDAALQLCRVAQPRLVLSPGHVQALQAVLDVAAHQSGNLEGPQCPN